MVRNRKEPGDLFPIRVHQMGKKGAQTKLSDLMWNQSQNVEKAKIKSRQAESFPVKFFPPPRKEVFSTKGHVQGQPPVFMKLLLFFSLH